MSNLKKFLLSFSLVITIVSLLYQFTGDTWPWFPLAGATVTLYIVVSIIRTQSLSTKSVAVLAIGLNISYTVGYFVLLPSLTRFDPQAFAVRIQWVINTGTISSLPEDFYAAAPLFTLLPSEAALITGLRGDSVLVIFPIVLSILIPLLSISIVRRIYTGINKEKIASIAALLASSGATLTQFGIAPIPEVLAVLFITLGFVSLIIHVSSGATRHLILFIMFVCASGLTHKIPVFIVFLTIIATIIATILFKPKPSQIRRYLRLGAIIGGVLVIQWAYLTLFTKKLLQYGLTTIFAIASSKTGIGAGPVGSHAVPVAPSLWTRVIQNGNLIIIAAAFFAALILCLYAWRSTPTSSLMILLSLTFVTSAFVILGTFTPLVGGSDRYLLIAEIPLAVTITLTAGIVLTYVRGNNSVVSLQNSTKVQVLFMSILAIVIVAQFGSIAATTDYPDTPRMYLTLDEIEGKNFESKYINNIVYTDYYYANFVVDPTRPVNENTKYEMSIVPPPNEPGILDEELRNKTLLEMDYKYISYRENVDIYRFPVGWVRLSWNPQQRLDVSRNRIYANGGVVIYNQDFHN